MRQAITTRFLGPTDSRGARIKASAQAGSITISWDYNLNADDNHNGATKALMYKLGWVTGCVVVYGGALPDGSGNAYVIDPGHAEFSLDGKEKPSATGKVVSNVA